MGLTAGLVNSERRKILSLIGLEIGRFVGQLGRSVGLGLVSGWVG